MTFDASTVVRLAGRVDPGAFARIFLRGLENAFWLDGGPGGDSVMGFGDVVSGKDALRTSDQEIRSAVVGVAQSSFPAFVGWIPYDFARATLHMNLQSNSTTRQTSLIRPQIMVTVHNASGAVTVAQRPGRSRSELAAWAGLVSDFMDRADREEFEETVAPQTESRWADSNDEYLEKIVRCQNEIAAGNAFVLCLTTRVTVPGTWDDVATFRALRHASPSHHGGLLRIGGTSLVSSSPERFIEVDRERRIRTHPIKGTRRRSSDPILDAALREELRLDGKERAENVMIVDLMRNDLSRVCELGSVEVDRLFDVESYAHVHQLVSTVSGRLLPEVGTAELLASLFPAGSMTGAPKAAAVAVLDSLESTPRGLYAGAFGTWGFDGTIDLAMTIRSIELQGGMATIGTGGGITALSVPDSELREIHLKAAATIAALRPPSLRVRARDRDSAACVMDALR